MSTQKVRRPADRKAQILRAAAAQFHERGFHEVGLGDIAGAVGISAPALYRHFRGKRDLLAAVVADGFAVMDAAVRDAATLDDAVRSMAELSVERRELGVLWQREVRHLDEPVRGETRQRFRDLVARLEGLLGDRRAELSPGDADLLVWSMVAVLGSPSHARIAVSEGRLAALLEQMSHTVLGARLPTPSGVPVPRGAAPSADRAAASRRESLVSAATRFFGQQGFHEARLEEIGAAAGIAGPSVYKHFASKSDLLYAALNRGAQALQLALAEAMASADDPRQVLRALLRAYVGLVQTHTDLFAALVTEVIHLPDDQRHDVRRTQRDHVLEWEHLLGQCRPDLPRSERQVRVRAVLGLVNDVLRTEHLRSRPALAQDLVVLGESLLLPGD
ncbi:TetR family transcriptional regulator [Streptomyces sp. NPDC046853]|uniref:TetR/AcrR family transcriptional regulator n=1 Tax=unclassified Streptomyces TaxID=2593676 RepID=UPI0033E2BE6F